MHISSGQCALSTVGTEEDTNEGQAMMPRKSERAEGNQATEEAVVLGLGRTLGCRSLHTSHGLFPREPEHGGLVHSEVSERT